MSLFIPPQSVTQNIARAKSLLKRDDPIRALDALMVGLEAYDPAKLMGKARFETEVLIQECLVELDRQPKVRALLASLTRTGKGSIAYTPGQEGKLKALLPILRKGLQETENARERDAAEALEERKNNLLDRGLSCLAAGDAPKGKAALRQLADEFGEEPGIYERVGTALLEAKLYFDAADFLEQAIEAFPKDSRAYASATACYTILREFEKAEAIYLKAIRAFGKHPKTMTNLARLYVAWNKKDKAYEAARSALSADPDNEEARALVAQYE